MQKNCNIVGLVMLGAVATFVLAACTMLALLTPILA